MDSVHGDSDGGRKVQMDIRPVDDVGQYEEQYNANHDFAIFHVGNQAVGGLMNLQQKQNQADIDAKSLNTSQNDTYRSLPEQTIDQSID